MSHEIFGTRFIGTRTPAWHNLGTVVDGVDSVDEALKLAGIDFTYETSPLSFETPDGEHVVYGDKVVIMRSPTVDDNQWRPLGTATESYAILQNDELARGMDDIAKATGWSFETAGALKHGASIFMTLDAGERDVKGDRYESYVLVSDSKVAGKALEIAIVPLRVVCQNTLTAALSSASFSVKIRHDANASSEYEFWTGLIPTLQQRQDDVFTNLDALAARKTKKAEVDAIINAAYPMPIKSAKLRTLESLPDGTAVETFERLTTSHQYWTDYANKHREAARVLYDRFNDSDEASDTNNSQFAGTAYAALQAVTELADWGGGGQPESTSMSALFGDRAKVKQRAWEAANSLI